MNIEELIKLKEELNNLYSEEKKSNSSKEELEDIAREITKVDSLIKIYQNNDKDYIVMKLERLYMMNASDIEENKFNTLNEDKIFEIFDRYFPDKWVIDYNLEEKEKYLLDAICTNKLIKTKKKNKFGE